MKNQEKNEIAFKLTFPIGVLLNVILLTSNIYLVIATAVITAIYISFILFPIDDKITKKDQPLIITD